MAAIDPDVEELLSSLLTTPIAAVARATIDSIVEDNPEYPEDRLFADFHPFRRSRYGQLDLAHRIISGRIKREIRMLQGLRQLAPELGLTSVGVLPPPDLDLDQRRDIVELLDPAREEALTEFLAVWEDVQSELRQRWDNPDAH